MPSGALEHLSGARPDGGTTTLLLHAAWRPGAHPADGRLLVWGVVGSENGMPGVAGTDAVSAALAELVPAEGAEATTVRLSIPVAGSSAKRAKQRGRFVEITVDALALPPVACLKALPRLSVPRVGRPTSVGPSLAAWAQGARFALELLARQRYVPQVEAHNGSAVAVWRPVLSDAHDAGRVGAVAASLPGVAFALAGEHAPHGVVEDFLSALVDAGVRAACADARLEETVPQEGIGRLWAESLFTSDGLIRKGAGLGKLERLLTDWAEPARRQATFRTCIRLEPPPLPDAEGIVVPSEDWRLRYGLQSTEDPSLIVPAEIVWEHGGSSKEMQRWGSDRPEELLLQGLGVAARLWETIAKSLDEATPTGASLNAGEAEVFARDIAPRLADMGLAALVPGIKPLQSVLAARLRAKTTKQAAPTDGPARFGLETLVQFDVELALGGQVLAPEEWEALVSLKAPLVRVRGQWVALRPGELEAARRLWKRRQQLTLREALVVAGEGTMEGYTVESVAAEGWLAALFGRPAEAADVSAPDGLKATLRPYQERGLAWLATMRTIGLGALLADDMGLGKTLQVLACELAGRTMGTKAGPTLVVCPASVATNWRKEAARFTPELKVLIHHGPERSKGVALARQTKRHDLVITTFALLVRDLESLERVRWSSVVIDEAQNIKNAWSKQAQAARALRADWRVALTGTPIENRLAEMWSILQFLNPGFLGAFAEFRRRYATPIERYGDAEASARLARLIRPFLLRRLKSDPAVAGDLPEKIETTAYIPLTREQASLYEGVVRDAMARIEQATGIERRGIVLSMLTRLKQVANHPAHFLADGSAIAGRSGKLERLVEMLDETLDEGDRCLVFTQFREMGDIIEKHLEARFGAIAYLHGGTTRAERDELVERFQSTDGPRIFLLSLRAGGTGLNLTAANRVFHFDRWWNPAVEDQATDRAYRIGQTRNVQVHKFVSAGTIEERIDELLGEKRGLADRIVGAGESWITELSNHELRDLLALRPGSVEESA